MRSACSRMARRPHTHRQRQSVPDGRRAEGNYHNWGRRFSSAAPCELWCSWLVGIHRTVVHPTGRGCRRPSRAWDVGCYWPPPAGHGPAGRRNWWRGRYRGSSVHAAAICRSRSIGGALQNQVACLTKQCRRDSQTLLGVRCSGQGAEKIGNRVPLGIKFISLCRRWALQVHSM